MTHCKRLNQVALLIAMASVTALASFALTSSAFAGHSSGLDRYEGRSDRDSWSERRYDRDSRWDRSDRNARRGYRSSRRSYFYYDPYCGHRSSHISDFKDHYGRADHPARILKIDIRTGDHLAQYFYDYRREEWRDGSRSSRRDHHESCDACRSGRGSHRHDWDDDDRDD